MIGTTGVIGGEGGGGSGEVVVGLTTRVGGVMEGVEGGELRIRDNSSMRLLLFNPHKICS